MQQRDLLCLEPFPERRQALRTRHRTCTSVAPLSSAPNMSASDAEKLQCVSSESRSAEVIASCCTASHTRCSTARWLFTTPLGWPVVPEV